MPTIYVLDSRKRVLDFRGQHVLEVANDRLKRLRGAYAKQRPADPEIMRAIRMNGLLYISFVSIVNEWCFVRED